MEWLDHSLFPFKPNHKKISAGRMHYIDEGKGEPIVFVHGTPTWSFLYRDLIAELKSEYRCIAPDHIGFGLSEKPYDYEYTFENHAENFAEFIAALKLKKFNLVVHDLGGPIGISYALNHPEKIEKLVIFNTLMWAPENFFSRLFAQVVGSPLMGLLYRRLNFPARFMMKQSFVNKTRFNKLIQEHYLNPHANREEREGLWGFARNFKRSMPWFDDLWERRGAIADVPAALIWGMKDDFFSPKFLERFREVFVDYEMHKFKRAGHFIPEEIGPGLATPVRNFLAKR